MSKMREECKHGSLRRSCEICDMETLLKSSEEEMLFWRHAFREVNAAQIAAEERVEELEAENAALKAERDEYEDDTAALTYDRDRLKGFITPVEGECQLGKEPYLNQCCCKCKYLLIDYWHCTNMPEELKEKGRCGCEKVRGYICTAGEIHGGVSGNSGWEHHSLGCECFTERQALRGGGYGG